MFQMCIRDRYLSDGKIQEHLENQNPFLWTSGFFKEHNYEVGEAITFDETKLHEKLNTFSCMQEENMIPVSYTHLDVYKRQ